MFALPSAVVLHGLGAAEQTVERKESHEVHGDQEEHFRKGTCKQHWGQHHEGTSSVQKYNLCRDPQVAVTLGITELAGQCY